MKNIDIYDRFLLVADKVVLEDYDIVEIWYNNDQYITVEIANASSAFNNFIICIYSNSGGYLYTHTPLEIMKPINLECYKLNKDEVQKALLIAQLKAEFING